MLVSIKASRQQLDAADADQIEELFEELVRANQRGNHFILIDRPTCDWAIDNLPLGKRHKAHLEHIKQRYTQAASLLSQARKYIQIKIGHKPLEQVNQKRFEIGHINLLGGNYLDKPRLIVENSKYDGGLFKLIADNSGLFGPVSDVGYQLVNGGGATIVACFISELEHRRIAICVVDSDKFSPHDPPSDTVTRLNTVADRQTFVGMIAEAKCREAENYIPIDIIRDHRLCPEFADFDFILDRIRKQTIERPSDCLWLYFDAKEGLRNEKMKQIDYQPTLEWLQKKWLEDEEEIEGLEVQGFGAHLLSVFLGCNAALSDFRGYLKSKYWRYHFSSYFEEIFWYLLVDKRKFTR